MKAADQHDHGVSFGEAVRVWARIALLSFGGPAGQIAVMHRILVDEKKWIGEERFLHALNFCMLLPGPEAQQLATYIGWLMHKVKGGLVAGSLFILPGLISIMALSWLYVLYGSAAPVAALFFGLKAAVVAIIFQAVFRIGSRTISNIPRFCVAAAAFMAIFFLNLPFPIIITGAALIGYAAAHFGSRAFAMGGHTPSMNRLLDEESVLGTGLPDHERASGHNLLWISLTLLFLWLAPVALLLLNGGIFADIATFFSKMAVVTFGGAYAVLAYVAQAAVENYNWLRPEEMIDGLGLAETTPGPLIMVTQFVGFLGAYRDPGSLPPLMAATLGGLLTTWVTFTPCFLWIFAGAPFVERLRGNPHLSGALSAVTAAVVGVVLNLAIWFALHYLFRETDKVMAGPITIGMPGWESVNPAAILLTILAMIAIFWRRAGIVSVIFFSAIGGLLLKGL